MTPVNPVLPPTGPAKPEGPPPGPQHPHHPQQKQPPRQQQEQKHQEKQVSRNARFINPESDQLSNCYKLQCYAITYLIKYVRTLKVKTTSYLYQSIFHPSSNSTRMGPAHSQSLTRLSAMLTRSRHVSPAIQRSVSLHVMVPYVSSLQITPAIITLKKLFL